MDAGLKLWQQRRTEVRESTKISKEACFVIESLFEKRGQNPQEVRIRNICGIVVCVWRRITQWTLDRKQFVTTSWQGLQKPVFIQDLVAVAVEIRFKVQSTNPGLET